MDLLRAATRPVIFETGLDDTPYSIAGTAFILGFGKSIFILTARHVVRDCPLENLLVFPTDSSRTAFRFTDSFKVTTDLPGEDVEDFIAIKTNLSDLEVEDRKQGRLIQLTPGSDAWYPKRYSAKFFLIGYPTHHNFVDYDDCIIKTGQVILTGKYHQESASEFCHVLSVENPLSLPTFDGFSGSPVFCLINDSQSQPSLAFCGMTLRGTPASSKIHFLDTRVLRQTLGAIEANAAA